MKGRVDAMDLVDNLIEHGRYNTRGPYYSTD